MRKNRNCVVSCGLISVLSQTFCFRLHFSRFYAFFSQNFMLFKTVYFFRFILFLIINGNNSIICIDFKSNNNYIYWWIITQKKYLYHIFLIILASPWLKQSRIKTPLADEYSVFSAIPKLFFLTGHKHMFAIFGRFRHIYITM